MKKPKHFLQFYPKANTCCVLNELAALLATDSTKLALELTALEKIVPAFLVAFIFFILFTAE